MIIVPIVEGDGEVEAVPVLLRHLRDKISPDITVDIQKPIRVRRDRFLNKDPEFTSRLRFADRKCGEEGWILILLDADDDCPAKKGREILNRARHIVGNRAISVVLANREYEAWFIASAASLNGKRGFVFDESQIAKPENERNAKGWLGSRMSSGNYSPIRDQPAFSAVMDIDLARTNSRSFQKLCNEWERNITSAESV